MSNTWQHEYANVNGIRMHYVRQGQGFPVIMLHGWPEFWGTWQKNIPFLAESFDVIAPDLRGFGDSEKPPGTALESYTAAHHVADIKALMDHLGIERAALVGHDVGAIVAQAFVREHPGLVASIAFGNCPYPGVGKRWADSTHIPEIWYQTFHQQSFAVELLSTSREALAIYLRSMMAHWSHRDDLFDDVFDQWLENFLKPGNLQGGFNWYRANAEARLTQIRDGAPTLDPVTVPTVFLWGESDPIITIRWADRLGDYFSDFELIPVPEAGHFAHFERPDFVNPRLKAFIERTQ